MSNTIKSGRGNGKELSKSIGTWEIFVAGVALVVASSTLVTDFSGFFKLGAAFGVALLVGFLINLMLGISAAELSVAYPRAGALYDYAREIFKGKKGQFLGIFLGLSFFMMFAFTSSGETAAGAFGFKALLNSDLNTGYFIIILSILAVIPNLFGIKTASWVSAGLLLLMLGIRWFFGIAGFLGLGQTGSWSAANLSSNVGILDLFGNNGILSAGLTLAFWSFVGIEFACSLAEEVKAPKKSLPCGIILGLILIVATSFVMGFGVTGTQPLEVWQQATAAQMGGEAPQLVVGKMMFGDLGFALMALASIAATLGTLTIAYAAMPRIIYSIARDGKFFGPLSNIFGKLHPKTGTPVAAILFTFIVYIIPALYSSKVIDWLMSAAYVWIILYIAFHLLAIYSRKKRTASNQERAFKGAWFVPMAVVGILMTLVGLYYAFAGAHVKYGSRALIVLAVAFIAAVICMVLPKKLKSSFRDRVWTGNIVKGNLKSEINLG